ncbi:MAG: hypothetical protein ACR5K7_02075 [Symbiopectobacterium sp.]
MSIGSIACWNDAKGRHRCAPTVLFVGLHGKMWDCMGKTGRCCMPMNPHVMQAQACQFVAGHVSRLLMCCAATGAL